MDESRLAKEQNLHAKGKIVTAHLTLKQDSYILFSKELILSNLMFLLCVNRR